jgi:hypothetical protein
MVAGIIAAAGVECNNIAVSVGEERKAQVVQIDAQGNREMP